MPVLDFQDVWKGYPAWSGSERTPRERLRRRVPALIRTDHLHWALRGVTLQVDAGECVGLIGVNGAGKSTLLRLGAQLSRPTRGHVSSPESMASVLALGEAFDLSLTGRENAYTTALLAGHRAAEARRILPDVLEFAELESAADEPVRTYSEGMKLRLAFGVVAQLHPVALIFDEVIAVGDAAFQAKCLAYVRALREQEGTAVLLATHALELVDDHCTGAVWLDRGAPRAAGEPASVTAAYRDAMRSESASRTPEPDGEQDGLELRRNRFGSQEVRIADVRLGSSAGPVEAGLPPGADLRIGLRLEPREPITDAPAIVVSLRRETDGLICFEAGTQPDGVRLPPADEAVTVELRVEHLDLQPGAYAIDVGAYRSDWSYAYDYHWSAYPLRIAGQESTGVLRAEHAWTVAR